MSIKDELALTNPVKINVTRREKDVIVIITAQDEYDAMMVEDKLKYHVERGEPVRFSASKL